MMDIAQIAVIAIPAFAAGVLGMASLNTLLGRNREESPNMSEEAQALADEAGKWWLATVKAESEAAELRGHIEWQAAAMNRQVDRWEALTAENTALKAEVEHYKRLYGIEAGQVDDLLRGSGFQ